MYSAGWGQPRQCVVTAGGLSSAGVPRSLCLLPLPLPAGVGSARVRFLSVRKGRRPGIPWLPGSTRQGGRRTHLRLQVQPCGLASDGVQSCGSWFNGPPRSRRCGSVLHPCGSFTTLAMHRCPLRGSPSRITPYNRLRAAGRCWSRFVSQVSGARRGTDPPAGHAGTESYRGDQCRESSSFSDDRVV